MGVEYNILFLVLCIRTLLLEMVCHLQVGCSWGDAGTHPLCTLWAPGVGIQMLASGRSEHSPVRDGE